MLPSNTLIYKEREPEDKQSYVCAIPIQQYISKIILDSSKKPLDDSKISNGISTALHNSTFSQYITASFPITFQVVALQVGLGAALIQVNNPVAFASKELTEVECHYANIEVRC